MTNWKSVQGSSNIITSKSLEGGEVFEGTYLGSHEGEFDNLLHDIKQKDGKTVTLAGCAALDYKLAACGENVLVRLTYCGKEPLTSGKRKGVMAHQWSVEMADDVAVTKDNSEVPL